MNSTPLHVIVLDDRIRFALHAWRYLSRSVGFGIGLVPGGGPTGRTAHERLETPAGDAVIWWISARDAGTLEAPGTWIGEQLTEVLREAKDPERRMFLVDVRGESTARVEFWRLALKTLDERGIRPDPKKIWLVSSYGTGKVEYGAASFPIYPKSSETLQRLAERIWRPRVTRPAEPQNTFHFLVSGAGFELKKKIQFPICPLGVSRTPELLEKAYKDDVWQRPPSSEAKSNSEDHLPLPPLVLHGRDDYSNCLGRAYQGLDQLWDILLEIILREAQQSRRNERSSIQKITMLMAEQAARESFRTAFFGDDWGDLAQALDATALPWNAWLTTNYTHFVDRAVALHNGWPEGNAVPPPAWRILSIASEAEHLLRRMFFGDAVKTDLQAGASGRPERFLFKLHGDLGDLSTMAVAGQDKELFSRMTAQIVDNLHWLYEAANAWLEQLLKVEEARAFWHIVGHGLKDETLVRTLERVVESTKKRVLHTFLFIQPEPTKAFDALPEGIKAWKWRQQNYPADAWMAMLRKFWLARGRMWTPLDDGDLLEEVRNFIQDGPGCQDDNILVGS